MYEGTGERTPAKERYTKKLLSLQRKESILFGLRVGFWRKDGCRPARCVKKHNVAEQVAHPLLVYRLCLVDEFAPRVLPSSTRGVDFL